MYTVTAKRLMKISITVLTCIIVFIIIVMIVVNSISCSASERLIPIYSVDRDDKKVAVTFDCAWGNSNTEELLKILDDAGARATFFVTGEFCDGYGGDVKAFAEAGHEIANHSDKHPHISGMNINELIADTRECSRKIEMLTGAAPTLYRAPYGEYDNNFITTVGGMGLKIIQWSLDSIDWQEPNTETIIKRTADKARSGDILLFHNDLENTTRALPKVLEKLTAEGFELVTVSELIYEDNYKINTDGQQIRTVTDVYADFSPTYSNDYYVNSAMEKLRVNLTIQEIYALSSPDKLLVFEKINYLLTKAEIAAIYEQSYEELYSAYTNLVIAAETYGAAEEYTSYNAEDYAEEYTAEKYENEEQAENYVPSPASLEPETEDKGDSKD